MPVHGYPRTCLMMSVNVNANVNVNVNMGAFTLAAILRDYCIYTQTPART